MADGEYMVAKTTVGGLEVHGTALTVDDRPVAFYDYEGNELHPDPGAAIEIRLDPSK